jgi:uncharacterized protein YigE (DUF2233 family)
MLLINDIVHSKFTQKSVNEKIRSGVGIIYENKIVFSVTQEVESFYNFSIMLKDLFGCKDALFLDGAISKMYIQGMTNLNYSGQFGPMLSVSEK